MRYTLRRHQDNESDPSFAVEVIDPWGVKCGHIARELAMELGPQVSEQAILRQYTYLRPHTFLLS